MGCHYHWEVERVKNFAIGRLVTIQEMLDGTLCAPFIVMTLCGDRVVYVNDDLVFRFMPIMQVF